MTMVCPLCCAEEKIVSTLITNKKSSSAKGVNEPNTFTYIKPTNQMLFALRVYLYNKTMLPSAHHKFVSKSSAGTADCREAAKNHLCTRPLAHKNLLKQKLHTNSPNYGRCLQFNGKKFKIKFKIKKKWERNVT